MTNLTGSHSEQPARVNRRTSVELMPGRDGWDPRARRSCGALHWLKEKRTGQVGEASRAAALSTESLSPAQLRVVAGVSSSVHPIPHGVACAWQEDSQYGAIGGRTLGRKESAASDAGSTQAGSSGHKRSGAQTGHHSEHAHTAKGELQRGRDHCAARRGPLFPWHSSDGKGPSGSTGRSSSGWGTAQQRGGDSGVATATREPSCTPLVTVKGKGCCWPTVPPLAARRSLSPLGTPSPARF